MADTDKLIPTARHEHSDIGERSIWVAAALMLGLLAGCALLTWWLYPQSLSDATLTPPLPLYPTPRLHSTGWVDEAHGVVHIRIADAMRIVGQEGIPGWPAPGAGP